MAQEPTDWKCKETNNLVKYTVNGKLDARADADKFTGDWRNLISGINSTLDAVTKPVKG